MADLKKHTKQISGNSYLMVSGRVLQAHEMYKDVGSLSITSEIVYEDETLVRFKATVVTPKGIFTGYAESDKVSGQGMEKTASLEVGETSAIGRALGFAGLGVDLGIASAEEVEKAQAKEQRMQAQPARVVTPSVKPVASDLFPEPSLICADCKKPIQDTATGAGMMKAADIAAGTLKTYGRSLCMEDANKAAKARR